MSALTDRARQQGAIKMAADGLHCQQVYLVFGLEYKHYAKANDHSADDYAKDELVIIFI